MSTVTELTRRGLLRAAATVGGTAAVLTIGSVRTKVAIADPESPDYSAPFGPVTVAPSDNRYEDLINRAYNGRFVGRPDSVCVVGSAEQVVGAVDEAVRNEKRIAVRSGGHCFEGFVDDPSVRIVIDISEMKSVYYDPEYEAFAVEAGATLGQLYRTLYLGWGVTIPGGVCPNVGAGGHVAGGGYGPLSLEHGLVVDHLYAVEVVVVDPTGRARKVVATCDPDDPNQDLWWAHTGGGGGNFGVVTRYWFRSPEASGDDPGTLLPRPPAAILHGIVSWQWNGMTEQAFTRLVRGYGAHEERIGTTRSPDANLQTSLFLYHRATGKIDLNIELDGTLPNAQQLLNDYIGSVTADIGVPHTSQHFTAPWMKAALFHRGGTGTVRFKSKSAFLRKPWTDGQVATAYTYLTDSGDNRHGALVHLSSFGGKINEVPPSATASCHRDSIIKAYYEISWNDPREDEKQLSWIREFYRAVHSDTGGVPVPNASNDGAFINYADIDLADPQWNLSGVPWHTLYYKDNYPRLQQIKARWDPRDVFRHALSIEHPVTT